MLNLDIQCECRAFRATLTDVCQKHIINRAVCYCHDCQSFIHYLKRQSDVLDEFGGTHIYQLAPHRLQINAGADQLAILRLSEKGPLRWYARCCRTPIGNTMPTRALSFIGMIERPNQFSSASQNALGTIRGAISPESACGDDQPPLPRASARSLILPFAKHVLADLFTGRYKRNPLFDDNGNPVAEATVLTPAERSDLLARVVGS